MSAQSQLDLGTPGISKPMITHALKHGETTWIGDWQIRNFHGYHQSREGGCGNWKFTITSFDSSSSGQNGYCCVALYGGGSEPGIPIDSFDRIAIHGQKYGRAHWKH